MCASITRIVYIHTEKFMPLQGITLFELSRRPPINVGVSGSVMKVLMILLFIWNAVLFLIIKNNKPVPLYYTMMLESLDGIGGNQSINISVQTDGDKITMQIGEPLPPKCLWNALILPYDCEADKQETELSKLHV